MQARSKQAKTSSVLIKEALSGKDAVYLQVKKRLGLYKSQLKDGDTKLHVLMRYHITVKEFNAYMRHVGEVKAGILARMPNDAGMLPIQECPFNFNRPGFGRAESTQSRMLRLTTADSLLAFGELIDERTVLNSQAARDSVSLRNNLRFACRVANRVRELELRSDTMPCFEKLSEDEQGKISKGIRKIRKLSDQYVSLSLQGRAKPTGFMHYRQLHFSNQKPRTRKLGNCLEYSKQAMEFFREEDSMIRIEAFAIGNGDHVFVVIGRAQGSNPGDYTTWGSDAVVCDAWAGAVFQASEMPKRMGDFYQMYYAPEDKYYKVITGFNPNYHTLDAEYELPAVKP